MIDNTQTALALFLSAVALGLAGATTGLAIGQLSRRRASPALVYDEVTEHRAHLVDGTLLALGVTLLLAWPQFFAVLKSYVPDLASSGVMCAFGVTRTNPLSVLAVLVLLPAALWSIGWSQLMASVVHRTASGQLARRRLVLAACAGLVALAASGAELVYLFQEKTGRRVTCCTQFLAAGAIRPDLDFVDGGWLPWRSHAATLSVYFAWNAATIAAVVLATRKERLQSLTRIWPWVVPALLGVVNLWLTHVAWKASVAPWVLELPHHHCVYELLTDTWAMGLAAGCAVAANAGLLGLPVFAALARPAGSEGRAVVGSVARACGVLLATELLIVGIHLL